MDERKPLPDDAQMGDVVLQVRELTRAYGDHVVVDRISFELRAGRMLALLGRNGCGKSTTMKVMAGAIPAGSGTVTVCGYPGTSAEARRSIGYVPDTRGLFPRLSGAEHLELAAKLAHMRNWQSRARELSAELEIHDVGAIPVAAYSHGQARRLSMAMALLPSPPLLLVDEPFDGVDPAGIDVIMSLLQRAAAAGAGVLLTTHILDAAAHADEVAMFSAGSLLTPVPTVSLLERYGDLHTAWMRRCEPSEA